MARVPNSPGEAAWPGSHQGAAGRSSLSGTQRLGLAGLRAILRRYISQILLDSVLSRAVEQHAKENLSAGELLKLVTADCMIGLRLFVKPALLPELMLELAELLEQAD